jgi:hypothetical protein
VKVTVVKISAQSEHFLVLVNKGLSTVREAVRPLLPYTFLLPYTSTGLQYTQIAPRIKTLGKAIDA